MPRKKSPADTPALQRGTVVPEVHVVDAPAPPGESLPFPIVAIGASAGGLRAVTDLLHELPSDTGMALVLIQHLSPTHGSMLAEILARATKMPVHQVAHDMRVEPNNVYVIPPGHNLAIGEGHLQLRPMDPRATSRPVDHFMRSLAEQHGHKSIAVVLSGTGNDGTLGVEEIKAAGGITFVQDQSAEQDGMPRSALAGGTVDYVLPPAEIAHELTRLAHHPYVVAPDVPPTGFSMDEGDLDTIVDTVRAATGVDFTNYKRNTLYRRITRRMLLHKVESARDYLEMLNGNSGEADALYRDVLINVTSFFRNPDAFEALKLNVFPKLTDNRTGHEPIRIWTLGCSTGEEAYSIAMAFREYLEVTRKRFKLQIFATDLNGDSIEKARAAVYGKGIVQDVSPERLRRFFVELDGNYRICKPIREMCVFARQNVLADPPFSRLDMIACRNMLIYLEPVLQQRLIPVLHYALRGSGYLWLGGSETIGTYRELFELVDAKNKIYVKRQASHSPLALPSGAARSAQAAATIAFTPREASVPGPQREAERLLLARYAPPAVVLNGDLDIVHFRGDTSPFLRPAPGTASLNLIKMLREGLMVAVRGAISRARRDDLPAREEGLKVRSNGGWRAVDIMVVPLKGASVPPGSMLVLFEEPGNSAETRMRLLNAETEAARVVPESDGGEKEVARLRQELAVTRDYLESVIEQQEAANEELQSANEEVQSSNEELQSINEELETSKEEIQSSNEELATVNDELQNRNTELSQSNNDLTNLLSSVQMAIVMLGPDLRIRRFTPAAEKLLNLIAADIGRPIADIQLNLGVDDLEQLLLDVIATVSIHERDVQDRQDRWYSMRIRPYRTLENKIDGAVIVLVDIDGLKKAEQALRESESRFELLANNAPVLIWMSDPSGWRFVNRAFEDFVGALESEIRAGEMDKYMHPDDRAGYLSSYNDALREKKPFHARLRFRRVDGEYRWMKAVAVPRFQPDGELLGHVGGMFDISDMKDAERALIELDRGKNEFLAMLAHELRNPLSAVRNSSRLLSETDDPAILDHAHGIIERQTAHMVRMVDDLLDVTRITHGKIQLKLAPTDLVAVARQAIESTKAERDAAGITLIPTLPDAPLWVKGDAMRLDQVLTNLLNNACKFTRNGGTVWLTVEREAGRGANPARAVLRVRDNGRGIEPEMLPRIFDLFVQGDRITEHARTGIGLGLTLAKRLVDLHDGTIAAHSSGPGQGSEFVVRLPATQPGEAPATSKPVASARGVSDAPMQRILIVDDNRDSSESLRLMLTVAGHDVRVVPDGSSAPEALRSFSPDVVLLDIGLPDINGYDVARNLRKLPRGREALLVAVTGYGRDEDVKKSQAAGIDEHLTKPIDPEALAAIIGRHRAR